MTRKALIRRIAKVLRVDETNHDYILEVIEERHRLAAQAESATRELADYKRDLARSHGALAVIRDASLQALSNFDPSVPF